jgi:hypothetical protein
VVPKVLAEDAEGLRELLGERFEQTIKQRYVDAHLSASNVNKQLMIVEGFYYLEYFHTIGSNDKVELKNNQLVTAKTNRVKVYIKRHELVGGVSAYETLQVNGKWVKATTTGNTLVNNENDGTFFQILGVGSHYVFQYFNPTNPTSSFQLGVQNKKIGTPLYLANSATELFKLVRA